MRLFPSDLPHHPDSPAVEIAGRVLSIAGRSLTLADAFAEIQITFATPTPLAPGDLAIIAGTLTSDTLTSATVIQRITPARPPGPGALIRRCRQFLRQLVVISLQPVPVVPKHSWHLGVMAVPSFLQALSPQTEAQAPKQAHPRSAAYALVAAEPSQSFAAPP